MVWKKVPPGDVGATDVFGGDDMNKVSDGFTGVDVDDFDINSDFSVRSGKRKLRNPANTFDYVETASAIAANRTVTEPLLTGNDTRVYEAHSQTLTNKTISGASNTLSAIPPNSISSFAITSPITNQILQYNGTNWVNATSSFKFGVASVANGGTITHGLSPATPTVVICTPTTVGEMVAVTAKTSTTFTVGIFTHAGSADTTPQIVNWMASL